MTSSLIESLASLPEAARLEAIACLSNEQAEQFLFEWRQWARPQQIAPDGDWQTWLVLAGRGFGKTRTGAEWVRERIKAGVGRIALIAPTASDARDVMVEGESGLLSVCWAGDQTLKGKPLGRPIYEPSKRRVTWANGAVATLFSAEEPERLRGPQHEAMWCDELAAWKYLRETWDMAMFGLRLGESPQVCITTTPKPLRVLKEIVTASGTKITRGATADNRANLAPAFLSKIVAKYEGTRLGRQELNAEILEDVQGALWSRDEIDRNRRTKYPELRRIVVAIDPAVSTNEGSDETGIIVAGVDDDDHGYVLADYSGRYTPEEWARKAVYAYETWSADRVVAEVNQGGDMVESTLRMAAPNIPYRAVHASRGKVTRAEPVSAIYEQSRVHHVGSFPDLEDQMCSFTIDYDRKKNKMSPDRLDALVWAMFDLVVKQVPGMALYEMAKAQAKALPKPEPPQTPTFAPGSVEYMKQMASASSD
jgi:phage terminase large subunit-like protein